jgi:urease subunit gamma/beta
VALTPSESDRLLLFLQGELARNRRARGLRLNVPEATAYIADAVCEMARDGVDLPTVRERARHLLDRNDVMDEVPDLLSDVRVEARFDDGTRLVVVTDLWDSAPGDEPGSPSPESDLEIEIRNEAATAIAISSHIHLAEVNPRLRLDRDAAFGRRLAVPAGTTVWIRAGESVTVPTTQLRGARIIVGNTGVVEGAIDDPAVRERALAALRRCGYLDVSDGDDVNEVARADDAVAQLMAERRDTPS